MVKHASYLKRFAQGDDTVIPGLYRIVYKAALRFSEDPDERDEIAQNTMLRIIDNKLAQSYEPKRAAETTFLNWVTRSVAIDLLRKKEKRDLREQRYAKQEEGIRRTAQDPNVLESLAKAEERSREKAKKRACFDVGTPLQRNAAYLRARGLKQEEIAEILDVPLGSVKSGISKWTQKNKEIAAAA